MIASEGVGVGADDHRGDGGPDAIMVGYTFSQRREWQTEGQITRLKLASDDKCTALQRRILTCVALLGAVSESGQQLLCLGRPRNKIDLLQARLIGAE